MDEVVVLGLVLGVEVDYQAISNESEITVGQGQHKIFKIGVILGHQAKPHVGMVVELVGDIVFHFRHEQQGIRRGNVVMPDDVVERRVNSIVHIGCGQLNVAQRRRSEFSLLGGSFGRQRDLRAVTEPAVPERIIGNIGGIVGIHRDRDVVVIEVGEQRACGIGRINRMAVAALGCGALEQVEAPLFRRVKAGVAGHDGVEFRGKGIHFAGAFKHRDGGGNIVVSLVDVAEGVGPENLDEFVSIAGVLNLVHHGCFVGIIHFQRIQKWRLCLINQRAGAPVEKLSTVKVGDGKIGGLRHLWNELRYQ